MNKAKLSALLSLILVFASGGVLGAFAYRLYSAPTVTPGSPTGGPPARPSPRKFVAGWSRTLPARSNLMPNSLNN